MGRAARRGHGIVGKGRRALLGKRAFEQQRGIFLFVSALIINKFLYFFFESSILYLSIYLLNETFYELTFDYVFR